MRAKYAESTIKSQLAEGASDSWPFNRIGESLRAFDTPLGRVGMMICNDRWNPMIARTLVAGRRTAAVGPVIRLQDP